MKKILKTLSGVLALTLVLSSTPSITANAAIDPFLTSRMAPDYSVDANGKVVPPETIVEQSNHIPQRVDLTPEQIQGLVACTLVVDQDIDENYKADGKGYILSDLPCQPMYYHCVHSATDLTPYFVGEMVEEVNYLGDYTIGGVLDPTKVVYEARVMAGYNEAGKELTRQRKAGQITYNQWLSALGTADNSINYQAFYRTTYNYAIIVNGQNSPTFNVGTNILAIISPLGDRMYFDVFGLDANGNVYIPDGYHYYNSLLNISYQQYKHNLGICRCTGTRDEQLRQSIANNAALRLARLHNLYIIPEGQEVLNIACDSDVENLIYQPRDGIEVGFGVILRKINGSRYTPVTVK